MHTWQEYFQNKNSHKQPMVVQESHKFRWNNNNLVTINNIYNWKYRSRRGTIDECDHLKKGRYGDDKPLFIENLPLFKNDGILKYSFSLIEIYLYSASATWTLKNMWRYGIYPMPTINDPICPEHHQRLSIEINPSRQTKSDQQWPTFRYRCHHQQKITTNKNTHNIKNDHCNMKNIKTTNHNIKNMKNIKDKTVMTTNQYKYKRCIHTCRVSGYGGFLSGNKGINGRNFLLLLYAWCFRLSGSQIEGLGLDVVTHKTRVGLFQKFRNVCSEMIKLYKVKLGGPGKKVEVDESNFKVKAKGNVGYALKIGDKWVVGYVGPLFGNENWNGVCLRFVDFRDAQTLNELTLEFVEPGSKINSDGWKGYSSVSKLTGEDGKPIYDHDVVIHEYNFKDPDTGACTNRIEGTWGVIKNWLRNLRGVRKEHLNSYLDEYCIRYNFSHNNKKNMFFMMLDWIAYLYPPHF